MPQTEVELKKTFDDPKERITEAEYSPDGKFIALPSFDSNIYILNSEFNEAAILTQVDGNIFGTAWHPNSTYLAAISPRTLTIFDTDTWETVNTFSIGRNIFGQARSLAVTDVAWHPSGNFVTVSAHSRNFWDEPDHVPGLIIYKTTTDNPSLWNQVRSMQFGTHKRAISRLSKSLNFSPDGNHLALSIQGGDVSRNQTKIRILDTSSPNPVNWETSEILDQNKNLDEIKFSPNGQWLAAPDYGRDTLRIYNTVGIEVDSQFFPPWSSVHTISPLHDGVGGTAWSPNNKLLALGNVGEPAEIEIWKTQLTQPTDTWERVATELRGHSGTVNTITWSPDGTTLVTASHDGSAKAWTLSQPQPTPPETPPLIPPAIQLPFVGEVPTILVAGVTAGTLLLATMATPEQQQ